MSTASVVRLASVGAALSFVGVGTIGGYGYNLDPNTVVDKANIDVMGARYSPELGAWIRGYNYKQLFSSYTNNLPTVKTSRKDSNVPLGEINPSIYPYNLLISGTISPTLLLQPAFTVASQGGSFSEPAGPYTIVGKDLFGNILFSQSFNQNVYLQPGSTAIQFAFMLPITAAAYSNLNSLTLTANGASTTLTSSAIAPPVVTAISTGSGMITITWDGGHYPVGDVVGSDIDEYIYANTTTGISTATISSSATSLTIAFSDNVKTTNVTVQVTQL